MKYSLNPSEELSNEGKKSLGASLKSLGALLARDKKPIVLATLAVLVSSILNLVAPFLVAHVIDTYILKKQYQGIVTFSLILFFVYAAGSFAMFFQTRLMGGVGQRLLFTLRSEIFTKLQELPIEFFHQNRAGDLISRINNDTDKLNQFFAQSLVRFIGNFFVIIGAGIVMVVLNAKLGLAALIPAVGLFFFTKATATWVKNANTKNLQSIGGMSAEIQESLNNFKVIVAFNRRDYFREKFFQVNTKNYAAAVDAGIANGAYMPTYDFAGNLAQLIVLCYGLYLVSTGSATAGLLIGYFIYVSRFYDPLRMVASSWSTLQIALAAWGRISQILSLQSNMAIIKSAAKRNKNTALLTFQDVTFGYTEVSDVLRNISFDLERGKTYAFVGPTGGGKTTTASLMARLYDPTKGTVLLDGRDIRSLDTLQRTKKIGCILQDAFLFTGTVRDNILYANPEYEHCSAEQFEQVLKEKNLCQLLERFEQGLDTLISTGGETISLGQRQLIAFMRAVLRSPEILILDEATANIDTVTEQLLEDILKKLPKETTKVIIAHRLNTIADADEIFFVNAGEVTPAGSLQHAVDMLLHGNRRS